ncbi:hypothetical protein WMF30_21235 [Sorangium sp. So ce134]
MQARGGMVEREGTIRSVTLEELAAIAGALEAGLPRDEVLAGAGLSVEAWEAARERWMSRLAERAARGQLRSSQRYLELVAEQKRRAEARARQARRKPEGPVPVAPAAHLSPLQRAPRDGAAPLPSAGAGGEAAARSPWARMGAAGTPRAGRAEPPAAVPSPPPTAMGSSSPPAMASSPPPAMASSPPPAMGSSPPPAMGSSPPPAMPSPLPAATPTPRPAPIPEPPRTAPSKHRTLVGALPVAPRDALPFRRNEPSAPPAESAARPAAAGMDTTRIGTASALPIDRALPFSRAASAPPADSALPFSRTASAPPADNALPFARPVPSPPADSALPFSRAASAPPADSALPFSRAASAPPADNALPFARPVPSPPADNALPFSRTASVPPADNALPFARPVPSPPADSALPFSRPSASPPVPPDTAPQPPQRSPSGWALPFQQPSSASGPPANASISGAAARAQAGAEDQEMRRVERITLGEYAHICADLREHPGHQQQIQSRYGLSSKAWAALHAMWHERFQSDPALKARWQALIEQSAQR